MSMEQERGIENSIIECTGVCKSFETPEGEHQVIKDFNLQAKENEFLVLFGPGQCGKTTMINLIAGFEKVSGGSLKFMGKEIAKPDPSRGVVFQSTALFPWMTTMGNVEYGLKMAGVKKQERQKRAQNYINLVGLQGFEKSYPVQLSGGMRQRVGIARAYCNEPKVMLMDEPFGALDAQTRTQLQSELIKTWQEQKKTCFFITHDVEEAVILATKVIIMSARPGRVKKIVDINLPYPRTQEMKMEMPFLDLKSYIWGEVYQEYLEVRK